MDQPEAQEGAIKLGIATKHAGPELGMDLPALEPGVEGARTGAWGRPCQPQASDGLACGGYAGDGSHAVPTPLPLDEALSRILPRRNRDIFTYLGLPTSVHGPNVQPPGTDARVGLHQSGGFSHEAGESRETATGKSSRRTIPGPGSSEVDLRSLSCPRLSNPHNICYINSFLLLMIWMHRSTGSSAADSFGRLRQAFEALQRMSQACVLSLFHWHPCLSTWTNISSQQDIAEFALFVLSWSRPEAYLVSWCSKRHEVDEGDRIVVTDSGCGFSPLIMDICQGGLQDCFDSWQFQSSVHGLRRETDFLLVQLRRYSQRGGRIFKTGAPLHISPGQSVWVPCWEEGMQLRYVEYHARALIFHLGANLTSGHYRAALSFGARTGLPNWYLTDDGIHPAMATLADLQMLSKNVYIVGLSRAELN